jgi:hypothetical protein
MICTKSPQLVDAEIALEGHRTQTDERKLISALAALPGVQEPILYGGLLVLQCDPSSDSKEHIVEAVEDVGLTVSWMKMRPMKPNGFDGLSPD